MTDQERGSPPLQGEVVRASEPEGFGQTTGLTQADLSGGLRRPVGRLRAKEVRGTSVAQPDDAAYAIASAIAALRWSAVPKQGNGLPCGGVGGECQTGASYEKPPSPSGQPPLQGGLSCPLDANWYKVNLNQLF